MVLVPLLTLLFKVDIRYAVGASLVSVIATSSGAAAAYVKEGFSNIRIGMFLEIATTMGAHQTIDPAQSSPFDSVHPVVVFDAVGVPGIIDDVMRRARHGTRLVVVGVCMQADTVHPFFGIAKEINVQFVLAYDPNEFADSLRAIAEGEIEVTPMITGDVGLEEVGAAFDDLADPERHCKILVTP